MIQFNLLPDVKLQYIKARRSKRLVLLGSIIAASASVAILIFSFVVVNVLQHKHLGAVKADIDKYSKELKDEEDLDKILTIQDQLKSLNTYHEQKPAAQRISKFLSQVTPSTVSISKVDVDYTANSIALEGTAPALKDVNEYVDTLKFSTYTVEKDGEKEDKGQAFSGVVMTDFTRVAAATYTITLSFQPELFDNTKAISIVLPKESKVTTRSVTEKPSVPLFQPKPQEEGGQ